MPRLKRGSWPTSVKLLDVPGVPPPEPTLPSAEACAGRAWVDTRAMTTSEMTETTETAVNARRFMLSSLLSLRYNIRNTVLHHADTPITVRPRGGRPIIHGLVTGGSHPERCGDAFDRRATRRDGELSLAGRRHAA